MKSHIFETLIVKKHQRNVTGIEDQIIALYSKGISTRDIQNHLELLFIFSSTMSCVEYRNSSPGSRICLDQLQEDGHRHLVSLGLYFVLNLT
ncbi:transposase [Desulfosporosinus orientis]|uniref:transposase n=1 Tax=Desulfosporosinus orientis TaxID=1563 RepID=UPI001FA7BE69|nr:transposase [Desulfosporosinus orientis]